MKKNFFSLSPSLLKRISFGKVDVTCLDDKELMNKLLPSFPPFFLCILKDLTVVALVLERRKRLFFLLPISVQFRTRHGFFFSYSSFLSLKNGLGVSAYQGTHVRTIVFASESIYFSSPFSFPFFFFYFSLRQNTCYPRPQRTPLYLHTVSVTQMQFTHDSLSRIENYIGNHEGLKMKKKGRHKKNKNDASWSIYLVLSELNSKLFASSLSLYYTLSVSVVQ